VPIKPANGGRQQRGQCISWTAGCVNQALNFGHHKVRTRNRVNQKVGLPQSGLANHTNDIRNPTSMLSERLVAGRK
jgi:hypothetical protein